MTARGLWKRFLGAGAIITLLVAVTTATAALLEVKNVADTLKHYNPHGVPGVKSTDLQQYNGGPQTVLILGSDQRYQDKINHNPARSDTIMLMRMNPNAGISLMSIPRDLQVTIPGRGTDKINDAYAIGGPKLTLKVVKALTALKINHIINIDFHGFRFAVDKLKCIYTDVDRRYFNANGGPLGFAVINIQPGYQKLCGPDALSYVRYRHTDTDLVRAARQQDFLRQIKSQVSAAKLFDNRDALVRIFARYTQTDINSVDEILQLGKLAASTLGGGISTIHFPTTSLGTATNTYVQSTPALIQNAVNQFLSGEKAQSPPVRVQRAPSRGRHHRRRLAMGLVADRNGGEGQAIIAQPRTPFPVYYSLLRPDSSAYQPPARVYTLKDLNGHVHTAYRMVLFTGLIGQYWGVQGTSWQNPPILEHPTATKVVNGRKLLLFSDSGRLRLVGWQTPRASYWVSNTLLETIPNRQMVAIAASLKKLPHSR